MEETLLEALVKKFLYIGVFVWVWHLNSFEHTTTLMFNSGTKNTDNKLSEILFWYLLTNMMRPKRSFFSIGNITPLFQCFQSSIFSHKSYRCLFPWKGTVVRNVSVQNHIGKKHLSSDFFFFLFWGLDRKYLVTIRILCILS